MPRTDDTHDPHLNCWVPSARRAGTDFPIQNLPHGVFRRRGVSDAWRGGVAIGSEILDLRAALATGAFADIAARTLAALHAAAQDTLNDLMAMGPAAWNALRATLSRMLREGHPAQDALASCLVPRDAAELRLPARVGEFTDFFTSADHMMTMGRLFQPDRPALPQFSSLPIAYHGRASTVEVSPTRLRRPWVQSRPPSHACAVATPTAMLDFELELGAWIGMGNANGAPVPLNRAADHLFGLVLLNDWSARDAQAWESLPLGPFLSKNFCTTASPWIVTMDALAPFATPVRRDPDDPPLLPYLRPDPSTPEIGLNLRLEVWLQPAGGTEQRITATRSGHSHWSFPQMLAHHTLNGCRLHPGDLLGSGTQSGPGRDERGCLMEITAAGREPLQLADGSQRTLLQDGDTVILRGWAERDGCVPIGLGECRGTVMPARADPYS